MYTSPVLWKNMTFFIGLSWLIYGAIFFDYSDWDIPLSLLMALSTYLTADKLIRAIKARSPLKTALYSLGAWWAVDGSYWLYWSLTDSSVMIREGQWGMSLCLYLLCGFVWTAFDPGKLPTDLPQPPPYLDPPDPVKLETGTVP